jgi:hypothetical protein
LSLPSLWVHQAQNSIIS